MTRHTNKRLLQTAVALLGTVPVAIGLAGVIFGPDFLRGTIAPSVDLDSHFRYLSGIFLALGLAFYATLPAIERRTTLFRAGACLVAIGGLARLASLLTVGVPSRGHVVGLGLELVIVPLLALWQGRVARAYAPGRQAAPFAHSK